MVISRDTKSLFLILFNIIKKNPTLFLHLLQTLGIIRVYLFLEPKYQKYVYDFLN